MLKGTVDMVRIITTAVLLVGVVTAQHSRATVGGSVLDSENSPIPNATVTLRSVDAPSRSITATTDSSGAFILAEIESGAYNVEIRATGFQTHKEAALQIRPEENIKLSPRRLKVDLDQAVCVLTVAPAPVAKDTPRPRKRK
jgi:hypothetical protein